jgi:hypothetical protein
MKYVLLFLLISQFIGFFTTRAKLPEPTSQILKKSTNYTQNKDTCIIHGLVFTLRDYHSKRVMRAVIKNEQLLVVNDGLQFAKYRIIQYVFSSLSNEYMPSFRWYNQRLSPPILQILKNARIGDEFLIEDIVVVDLSNNILPNEVRPLVLERVKE